MARPSAGRSGVPSRCRGSCREPGAGTFPPRAADPCGGGEPLARTVPTPPGGSIRIPRRTRNVPAAARRGHSILHPGRVSDAPAKTIAGESGPTVRIRRPMRRRSGRGDHSRSRRSSRMKRPCRRAPGSFHSASGTGVGCACEDDRGRIGADGADSTAHAAPIRTWRPFPEPEVEQNETSLPPRAGVIPFCIRDGCRMRLRRRSRANRGRRCGFDGPCGADQDVATVPGAGGRAE